MTIIGRQSGPDFSRVADVVVTSSVLISCWVSSALVEHWVRRPSSRSAQTSIIDCTSFRARRISSSPSAIPRAQRSTRKPRGSSPGGRVPFYFTGITGRPPGLAPQSERDVITAAPPRNQTTYQH